MQGIAHRDIKTENILLTSTGGIKLADFGLAIDTNEERPVTRAGTLDYMVGKGRGAGGVGMGCTLGGNAGVHGEPGGASKGGGRVGLLCMGEV